MKVSSKAKATYVQEWLTLILNTMLCGLQSNKYGIH